MAKGNGDGAALTKADVAKLVSGTVTVPVMKGGKPVVLKDSQGKPTGVYQTETVRPGPDHILGFRVDGNDVVATTVDGQKLRAAIA